MEKNTFSKADISLVCSYLRVGADVKTALTAMVDIDGTPWNAEKRADFKKQHMADIEAAQAQCRVLCLHNIMTEGGVTSSQFILRRNETGGGEIASPFGSLEGI